jgi:hypothetical protein
VWNMEGRGQAWRKARALSEELRALHFSPECKSLWYFCVCQDDLWCFKKISDFLILSLEVLVLFGDSNPFSAKNSVILILYFGKYLFESIRVRILTGVVRWPYRHKPLYCVASVCGKRMWGQYGKVLQTCNRKARFWYHQIVS